MALDRVGLLASRIAALWLAVDAVRSLTVLPLALQQGTLTGLVISQGVAVALLGAGAAALWWSAPRLGRAFAAGASPEAPLPEPSWSGTQRSGPQASRSETSRPEAQAPLDEAPPAASFEDVEGVAFSVVGLLLAAEAVPAAVQAAALASAAGPRAPLAGGPGTGQLLGYGAQFLIGLLLLLGGRGLAGAITALRRAGLPSPDRGD